MIAIVPLLVLLIGLVLYYRPSPPCDPRTVVIGLHCFWVGLLVFLLDLGLFVAYLDQNFHR